MFADSIGSGAANRHSEEAIIHIAEPNEMSGPGRIFGRV